MAAPNDDTTHAANVVQEATVQIDRLRRMRRAPSGGENREALDAVLDDLESARRKVLQDLREVELEPRGAVIRRQLEGNLGHLQGVLQASYEAWPPRWAPLPHMPRR
jgi:hypothetical protein